MTTRDPITIAGTGSMRVAVQTQPDIMQRHDHLRVWFYRSLQSGSQMTEALLLPDGTEYVLTPGEGLPWDKAWQFPADYVDSFIEAMFEHFDLDSDVLSLRKQLEVERARVDKMIDGLVKRP